MSSPTARRSLGPPIFRAHQEEARLDMSAVDHYLQSMEDELQITAGQFLTTDVGHSRDNSNHGAV